MKPDRALTLWITNLISCILLALVALTGLFNWLLLPRGAGAGLRHLTRDLHQWSGVMFLGVVLIHLVLHRSYICKNLRRSGILK